MWTVEKILSLTKINGGCLEWVRCLNTDGYPRIGPNIKVHRLLYELLHKVDIKGKVVMHTCDNPKCLNPDHLKLGTFAENNTDRMLKDRSYRTITKDIVERIQSFPEGVKRKQIAKELGIDPRRVSEVKSGKRGHDGRLIKQRML